MNYCKGKVQTPCFQYRNAAQQPDLEAFIKSTGGKDVQFLKDGTAIFPSLVRDEERFAYIRYGHWVRAVGKGQYSIMSNGKFTEQFELITPAEQTEEPPVNLGILANMSAEQAQNFADRMNRS